MTTEGNLPSWPGASTVYSRAYRILESMAPSHVAVVRRGGRRICIPSEEMTELVEALNSGDEERIKGLLLMTHIYSCEEG